MNTSCIHPQLMDSPTPEHSRMACSGFFAPWPERCLLTYFPENRKIVVT